MRLFGGEEIGRQLQPFQTHPFWEILFGTVNAFPLLCLSLKESLQICIFALGDAKLSRDDPACVCACARVLVLSPPLNVFH